MSNGSWEMALAVDVGIAPLVRCVAHEVGADAATSYVEFIELRGNSALLSLTARS